jgi:hypothetical protein
MDFEAGSRWSGHLMMARAVLWTPGISSDIPDDAFRQVDGVRRYH